MPVTSVKTVVICVDRKGPDSGDPRLGNARRLRGGVAERA